MKEYYSVHLPVKKFIYKYVSAIERIPIALDGDTQLSIVIREFVEKTSHRYARPNTDEFDIVYKTENIEILIPLKQQPVIGNMIHQKAISHINEFLEDCFHYLLRRYMEDNVKEENRYKNFKHNMIEFAERYKIDIEDDLTFDALKQFEFRRRQKQQAENHYNNHLLKKIIPAFEKGIPIFSFGYKAK